MEGAIASFASAPNGGLVLIPDVATVVHRHLIIALAARHRLPAVYALRVFVVAGGLMSYGVDFVDLFRQAAFYVDRILRGDNPADGDRQSDLAVVMARPRSSRGQAPAGHPVLRSA